MSIFFETATVAPLALIWVIVPLILFAVGIKTTPVSLAGVLMYLNPTAQLLLGMLVYHEEFNATYGILFGFVWTSRIRFLISGRMKREKTQKESELCV